MKQFNSVLKYEFAKQLWFFFEFKACIKDKKKRKNLFFGIIAIFWIYFILFVKGASVGEAIYANFKLMDLSKYLIPLIFIFNFLMSMIFEIRLVFGQYFSDKDAKFYLSLPVKSINIVMAKTLKSSFLNFLPFTIISLIIVIPYARENSLGFMFYVFYMIMMFFLTLVPVTIISFFVIKFGSIFAKSKYKKVLNVFFSLFFFLIVISPQIIMNNLESFKSSTANFPIMMKSLLNFFPFVEELIELFENPNKLSSILIFLTILAVISVFTYFMVKLLGKNYENITRSEFTVFAKAPKTTETLNDKVFKENKLLKTLILVELKTLSSNSVYILNILIAPLILPIFILAINFGKLNTINTSLITNSLYNNKMLIENSIAPVYVMIALGILFGVMTSFSPGASLTTISREQSSASIRFSLPIPIKFEILARLLVSFLISFTSVIFVAIFAFVFGIKILDILVFIVSASTVIISQSLLAFFIDIKRPMLKVASAIELSKNNFNSFIYLISNITIVAISASPWYFNYLFYFDATPVSMILATQLIFVFFIILFYALLNRGFRKLEI